MNTYATDRKERRNRQAAFCLAIAAHLAFGAMLYFQSSSTPEPLPVKPRITYPHPTTTSPAVVAKTSKVQVP